MPRRKDRIVGAPRSGAATAVSRWCQFGLSSEALLRLSLLLLLVLAVEGVPLSGAAAPPAPSLSNWTKAKHAKVLEPSKAPPPPPPEPAPRPAAASAGPRSKGKSEGPAVNGKVAVFGFTGDGAARVQQVVVSTLRTRGLHVTTGLRPVDSAEQYREMAATLQLAAYIEGTVGGEGSRGQATVHLRSGVTGRRIASVRFSGERSGLATDVGNGLWPRAGGQLARLCAQAAKPRKGGRHAMRINAGTPIEDAGGDNYDVPPHLRNDPPKERHKDDPWADEGT
jgi:hypothetical protein